MQLMDIGSINNLHMGERLSKVPVSHGRCNKEPAPQYSNPLGLTLQPPLLPI